MRCKSHHLGVPGDALNDPFGGGFVSPAQEEAPAGGDWKGLVLSPVQEAGYTADLSQSVGISKRMLPGEPPFEIVIRSGSQAAVVGR